MSDPHRQTRMVPTAKVREWLVWFGERSTQDPKNTENRKLSNRLYDYCQRAGAPGSTIVARGTSAATKSEGRWIAQHRFFPRTLISGRSTLRIRTISVKLLGWELLMDRFRTCFW